MRRLAPLIVLGALAVALTAAPALAIYPQLQTTLSGPAIGGRTPTGDAKIDQSKLPEVPGRLDLRVKDVNLPDGTVLTVNLGGRFPGDGTNVATFTLRRSEGQVSTTLQFQVGRTAPIAVMSGQRVVLSGGAPWKV